MSKLAFVFIGALAAGAFGCDDNDLLDDDIDETIDEDATDTADDDDSIQPVAPATLEWRATLIDVDPSTNLAGDVVVFQTEGEDAFNAAISVRNDSATCSRPWHVHFGTCATGGDIVGDPASYTNLTIGTDGAASADVVVRTGLDPAGAYHVNVHYSDSQLDRIIACGDLVLQAVVVP